MCATVNLSILRLIHLSRERTKKAQIEINWFFFVRNSAVFFSSLFPQFLFWCYCVDIYSSLQRLCKAFVAHRLRLYALVMVFFLLMFAVILFLEFGQEKSERTNPPSDPNKSTQAYVPCMKDISKAENTKTINDCDFSPKPNKYVIFGSAERERGGGERFLLFSFIAVYEQ